MAVLHKTILEPEIYPAQTADLTSAQNNKSLFYTYLLEKGVLKALSNFKNSICISVLNTPLAIMISLLRLKGYEIAAERQRWGTEPTLIDRNEQIVPEVVVDNFDYDAEQALRPAFDTIWNAAGCQQSPNYDGHGKWINRG